MRHRRSRLGALVAVAAIGAVGVFASPAFAAKSGNSANAFACQKGGWMTLFRADHTVFANQDECVSYGAQGGEYGTPPPTNTGTGVFNGVLASGDGTVPNTFVDGDDCAVLGNPAFYDAYPVTLVAPATLTITHQGEASGSGTLNDPYLTLYSGTFDPSTPCTNALASNDDFGSFDSFLQVALPAGQYTVVATSTNAASNPQCCGTYKLTITAS